MTLESRSASAAHFDSCDCATPARVGARSCFFSTVLEPLSRSLKLSINRAYTNTRNRAALNVSQISLYPCGAFVAALQSLFSRFAQSTVAFWEALRKTCKTCSCNDHSCYALIIVVAARICCVSWGGDESEVRMKRKRQKKDD